MEPRPRLGRGVRVLRAVAFVARLGLVGAVAGRIARFCASSTDVGLVLGSEGATPAAEGATPALFGVGGVVLVDLAGFDWVALKPGGLGLLARVLVAVAEKFILVARG